MKPIGKLLKMTYWELFLLSLVQGLTEFLPVSSSAHLILLGEFINKDQGIIFDISVHFGTLLAAIIYFRKEILNIIKGLKPGNYSNKSFQQVSNIILATLPILFCGYFLRSFVDDSLRSSEVIAYATIFFGLILFISDRSQIKSDSLDSITSIQALYIGLSQCLALIPGTSRSGITISTALLLGIGKETASKFSFLIAIPTIGAITISEVIAIDYENLHTESNQLLLSCFIAFIVAYLTIGTFLKFIKKLSFTPFVLYRIILGSLILIFWV